MTALLLAGLAARWDALDWMLLCAIVLSSALNQWLMVLIFGAAFRKMAGSAEETSNLKLAGKMVLKMAVILVSFYALIKFGRHLVLHGIILYTFQLIILVMSIKKGSAFSK